MNLPRGPVALCLGLLMLVLPPPLAPRHIVADDHWAYQPVARPVLPTVAQEVWPRNPVDHFILAQLVPEDLITGQRFAFITGTPNLAGLRYKFSQHGQCGAEVSELLPHLAGVVDEVAIVRSMHTDAFNHEPATTFFNTGTMIPGRPSMGSWLTYGLESETSNLPGFVVLASGISTGPPAGLQHWSSGFLPTVHQGVRFRSQGEAVLFVSNPPGINRNTRRRALDALRDLNQMELDGVGDPEIATRIAAFETAFQMQISVPNLTDLSTEPQSVLEMCGAQPGESSFASNCLLACRLARRGVRFIQL